LRTRRKPGEAIQLSRRTAREPQLPVTPASTLHIDLDAIADNWRLLNGKAAGATAAVLKADAYGLGARHVAPKLAAAGCKNFFTAHLSEALDIRAAIPGAMLAVLHGILPGEAELFTAHNLVPVLCSLHDIDLWQSEARRQGRILPALLHIDTGMARTGLSPADIARLRDDMSPLDGIGIRYVMTHLVSAEIPVDPINRVQFARFRDAATLFPNAGASLANSSGTFLGDDFTADLARPGAALYGINPTPKAPNPMRPAIRLTARILQIRDIAVGEPVGYNATWTAARPSRIAAVAVGYADGFSRHLSNRAHAMFDGIKIPLVGRVSMDLSTYDVTDTNAGPGDDLELIGAGHDADALAIEAGTNGYEILTSLGRRYQRRYSGAVSGV
jgi:alanine racemase